MNHSLLGILLVLSALPIAAEAHGNRRLHCQSKSAQLAFHTFLWGSIAVGDYTISDGLRAELPREGQSTSTPIEFYSQNRIFRIEDPDGDTPLPFKLLMHFGAEATVIEEGTCEKLQ